MSFLSILNLIFLEPFKTLFEILFYITNKITISAGVSLIVLGFLTSMMLLPAYKSIHAIQEKYRILKASLKDGIADIKANHTGEERTALLKNYYKQNNYSPLISFNDFMYLLFEVPIFVALYLFIPKLSILENSMFGLISNLASPDALIKIGNFSINILPVFALIISLVSIFVYSKNHSLQSKIQLCLAPIVYFIFLYKAPSGLVFFWLVLNVFSLLNTLTFKFKKSKKYVDISLSAIGLGLIIAGIFGVDTLLPGGVLQLPIIIYLLKNIVFEKLKKSKKINQFLEKQKITKPNGKQFVITSLLITLFIGVFIPSTYIAASPQEYINVNLFFNPLNYVLSSFLLSASIFMLWIQLFYWLTDSKTKIILEKSVFVFIVIMLVDYMCFGLNLGIISSTLKYENGFVFGVAEIIINTIVVIALCLFFAFAYKKIKSYISLIMIMVVAIFSVMSTFNIVNSAISINKYKKYNLNKSDINFSLSTKGQNVVVIMLDRAIGQFIPYLFNENPNLAEQFDGFTYYPNTISFGNCTNVAAPALLGGYEYTPVELNKRDNESLKDKNNEANLVLPRLFAEQGYKVSVADPIYTNYQWISDLTIFNEYENINAFHTIGKFVNVKQTEYTYQMNLSNFFRFSFMKTLPVLLQNVIYDGGNYNTLETLITEPDSSSQESSEEEQEEIKYGNQTSDGMSKATGIYSAFMDNYLTLSNLESMTMIDSDDTNTFLFLRNDITHETMIVDEEAGYVPSFDLDNTEYDQQNAGRFTLDGKSVKVTNYTQMSHYQANMVALMQVGKWLDYLRETGTYDNTRIILVSDHGRNINSVSELYIKNKNNEAYCPLLMVKDFNSTGFKTSTEFMTNADVATLATQNLIHEAKNPFTGKTISMDEKFAHPQYISRSIDWNVSTNNGNTFLASSWASFDSTAPNCNIYNPDNWDFLNQDTVLKSHSF